MKLETLTLSTALHVAHHMRREDRECMEAVTGACDPDLFALNRWQTEGAAWALVGGEPVAIGGLSQAVPWIGRLWFIATDAMTAESWKKLLRHTRTVLSNASKAVPRIEAEVLGTWVAAERFIRHLGFELEGIRRRAGRDGQDILMFVYRGAHVHH